MQRKIGDFLRLCKNNLPNTFVQIRDVDYFLGKNGAARFLMGCELLLWLF
jgi:hypothetical protein